jgi:DNA-binding transcriptional ArsR family regulator
MKDALCAYADKLSALGHKARLEIVCLLLSSGLTGLVVTEIQERTSLPASTLAHHLDSLRREGLVAPMREGKFVRYTASHGALEELAEFLRAGCLPGRIPFVERRRGGPFG